MEIDCNDKIDKNEKILAKEILVDVGDKNIEKCCEIVDKKQKLDMVANTQDSNTVVKKTEELTDDVASSEDAVSLTTATSTPAESTTATVTEDADGVDSGGGGGSDTEVEFVTKVDDSEDCDKNKFDKSKEEHKSQKDSASGSSTEMEEKQICEEILLVPMTIGSVESQDGEEEECEKSFLISSSPLKGSGGGHDVELISDIDDYNEEEDNIDGNGEGQVIGEDEDYENDTSSLTSNLDNNRPVNPTKSSSDLDEDDEDDSESDEFSEEDDDDNEEDDVIELVPDSSDEDDNNVVQQNVSSSRHHNISITTDDYEIEDDDDDGDDEYDDDDLMDDVVMSSKKNEQKKSDKAKVNNKCEISRKKEPEQFKKKIRWDYRTQLKKRSVKWLINKIRKETVTGVQYVYKSGSGPNIVNKGSSSNTQYTPVKSSQSFNEEVELISIDLDDSPEKLQPTQSGHTLSKQLKESSSSSSSSSTSTPTRVKQKLISDMQQVDKIRDSIQNAEDLKQQQHVKSIKDEQNKENVENNDKLLSNSLKLNGSVGTSRTDEEKRKEKNDDDDDDDDDDDEDDDDDDNDDDDDEECNDKVEIIMDISTEDEDKTLEQNIVKKLTEEEVKKKNAQPKDNENKCEKSRENTEKDKKKKNEINKVSITNEAVKSEMNVCENIEMAQDKNICKDSQETDLKKSPPTKRVRSASLEETTKQENIHPTKKLRAELESNFPTHDKILSEYIEKTSNNSVDEIQKHINQLIIEIQTINDMIKAKEIEWNNMLHLKKVKEEICFRLSRKRQMMEIVSTKIGEANLPINEDVAINETILQNSSVKPTKLYASTPNVSAVTANFSSSILNNLSNAAIISGNNNMSAAINNTSSSCGSTAQSILHNRANMKSSDLAKEKANTQRLHRLLVSRNILPKPSSSTSTAVAGFGASTQVSIPKISSTSAILATTAATTSLAGGGSGGGGNNMMHIPLHAISSGTAASFGLTSNGALSSQQPILNSYLTAAATVQQQLGEMLNGHHNPLLNQQNNTNGSQTLMVGRQGVFKDVKSIIADYRQRHPEQVPRRGRRVKSNPSATDSSSILSNVLKNDGKLSNTTDLGALLQKFDGNSRPSSNDSSHSMTNLIGASGNNTNLGNVSFKDVLVQFAKMSGQTDRFGTGTTIGNKLMSNSTTTTGSGGGGTQSAPPPPYPEVTLHPVSTSQSNIDQTGSLLHGILTKYTRPNVTSTPSVAPTSTSQTAAASQNFSSTFSPTLARLLTAPERINTGGGGHNTQTSSNSYQANLQAVQSAVAGSGLNLSKVVGHNSEITITPVITSQPLQQTILQQQLQQQQQHLKDAIRDRVKSENLLNLDDEADDSVDRLVIDEGGDSAGIDEHHRIAPHAIGQEFHENEVPACQGCKKQEAQFVCAGCGNQWYCSRECQVAAWDDHSEVCTG